MGRAPEFDKDAVGLFVRQATCHSRRYARHRQSPRRGKERGVSLRLQQGQEALALRLSTLLKREAVGYGGIGGDNGVRSPDGPPRSPYRDSVASGYAMLSGKLRKEGQCGG